MPPRRKRAVYLDQPNVGAAEKRELAKAIDMGYVSTAGPLVERFEKKFARYCGASKAVSTQSGTAALHMALLEAGVRAGDEVIVPVLTFVATANPIIHLGAKPVFLDVNPDTWNLDVGQVEKAITSKTKALLPVHLFGNPCEMEPLLAVAKRRRIIVIEDATESLGATYRKKMTGTLGHFGCFSFNGNKIMTTGGGGMVLGRDGVRLEHIRFLVNQARRSAEEYFHPEAGFNYRMTNIEAALGLAQMGRLRGFLEKKRLFNDIYRRELEGVRGIRFQRETSGARGSWWLSSAVFERHGAAGVQERLRRRGIPSRRLFVPLTEFPYFSPFASGSYPVARRIYDRGLCLPSSTLNAPKEVEYVCSVIKEIVQGDIL